MDENLAMEEKAAAGDSVSIEVLRSIRFESQRELEAVNAKSQYTSNGDDSSFDMVEYLQENTMEPPVVLGDSKADNEADNDGLPIPMWQTLLSMEGNTATGTSSDAKSQARVYKRSHKVWIAFQASLTTNTFSRFNFTSKDLNLSGCSDDYVNRGLA
jgi:head-tail adaptor